MTLAIFWGITAAGAEPACPTSQASATMQLPHLRASLATNAEGLIVALGSSSTAGVMASDTAHTYPAALQAALMAALPHTHITVLNRGIGGQDAPEELARLQTDVLAVRPHLVIWQVGANGAMRGADPAEFGRLVAGGVQRMTKAGIDVILMDNQRSPHVMMAPTHAAIEAALAAVATETGVNLFSRGKLMDAWSRGGFPYAQFIAADGLHHNDLGYRCVTRALAADITAAVQAPLTVTSSR